YITCNISTCQLIILPRFSNLSHHPSDLPAPGSKPMPAKNSNPPRRCPWAATEPNVQYHDQEWGVPLHDDQRLFEFLILEGAQAGLSWETILKKRDNYRTAFQKFDPAIVARFGAKDEQRLLADPGIVRNRLKIASAIQNAKAFLEVKDEFKTFDNYIWQ